MHGPCGAIRPDSHCMQDPNVYLQETQTENEGYPRYHRCKRKEGGKSTTLRFRGQKMTLENQLLVPYNKLLCNVSKAHINV